MVSAGHVGGTRGSGIVSSAAVVLWMRRVSEVCEMCMCLIRGGLGGEHTSSLQLRPRMPHVVPLDLWTDPAGVTALLAKWREKLSGGPQAGRSDYPH